MNQPRENREAEQDFDQEEQRLLKSGSLVDKLGIKPQYAPDDEAPPIDYRTLRALIRGDLDEIAAREVTHLIATYRPWHEAWRDTLKQEAGRSPK